VLIFNNTVWYAGGENDRDASVLFYYFDMEKFMVLPPSVRAESPERQHCVDRLGFNSMMDDEEFAEVFDVVRIGSAGPLCSGRRGTIVHLVRGGCVQYAGTFV
jgi:hypothetical protein